MQRPTQTQAPEKPLTSEASWAMRSVQGTGNWIQVVTLMSSTWLSLDPQHPLHCPERRGLEESLLQPNVVRC